MKSLRAKIRDIVGDFHQTTVPAYSELWYEGFHGIQQPIRDVVHDVVLEAIHELIYDETLNE
tara:strand:- start:342 stop:527 length:186 start_codon:yes stop_codon:yes gene_type:complete